MRPAVSPKNLDEPHEEWATRRSHACGAQRTWGETVTLKFVDLFSAHQLITSIRSGGGGAHVGGVGGVFPKTASATITPRQAGVAIGLAPGRNLTDVQIAVLVTRPNVRTNAFVQQIQRRTNDLMVDKVGPMNATDPVPAVRSANPYRGAIRPLLPGSSVGNIRKVHAGTLGGFVEAADGATHVLSNNHVLALSTLRGGPSTAATGDLITQPGRLDGGSRHHGAATLSGCVPLDSSDYNYMDVATARVPNGTNFDVSWNGLRVRGVRAPLLGEPVFKVGRTTQVTIGRVIATDVGDFPVEYNGTSVYFDEQILVQGKQGAVFSEPGDSGSLIVAATDNHAVALLFAGNESTKHTIASPLERVLREIGMSLIY